MRRFISILSLLTAPLYGARVSGWVDGSCGDPVPRVTVLLADKFTGRVTARAVSDQDGDFEFRGVPAGTYELRIASESKPLAVEIRNEDLEEQHLFIDTHPPAGMCPSATALVHPKRSPQAEPSRLVSIPANWKTFTSRGGWSVRIPPDWAVSSCVQCADLRDPDVFVVFTSSGKPTESVMVDPLTEQPRGVLLDDWLHEVARSTNLTPEVEETWTSVGGLRALRVVNRTLAGERTESLYTVGRGRTFALRGTASPTFEAIVASFGFR